MPLWTRIVTSGISQHSRLLPLFQQSNAASNMLQTKCPRPPKKRIKEYYNMKKIKSSFYLCKMGAHGAEQPRADRVEWHQQKGAASHNTLDEALLGAMECTATIDATVDVPHSVHLSTSSSSGGLRGLIHAHLTFWYILLHFSFRGSL